MGLYILNTRAPHVFIKQIIMVGYLFNDLLSNCVHTNLDRHQIYHNNLFSITFVFTELYFYLKGLWLARLLTSASPFSICINVNLISVNFLWRKISKKFKKHKKFKNSKRSKRFEN